MGFKSGFDECLAWFWVGCVGWVGMVWVLGWWFGGCRWVLCFCGWVYCGCWDFFGVGLYIYVFVRWFVCYGCYGFLFFEVCWVWCLFCFDLFGIGGCLML